MSLVIGPVLAVSTRRRGEFSERGADDRDGVRRLSQPLCCFPDPIRRTGS
jgi:hypothetical protein